VNPNARCQAPDSICVFATAPDRDGQGAKNPLPTFSAVLIAIFPSVLVLAIDPRVFAPEALRKAKQISYQYGAMRRLANKLALPAAKSPAINHGKRSRRASGADSAALGINAKQKITQLVQKSRFLCKLV